MNDALLDTLRSLVRRDAETRSALAATGALFAGYHPEMERVHRENAAALGAIFDAHGWPGRSMVGEEGSYAAWLVVQHAISMPDFQRRGRELLKAAVDAGEAQPAWLAKLTDRIRVYEGKGQIYGTHFDWDERGVLAAFPLDAPDEVDARRREVGLPPLEVDLARLRAQAEADNEVPPGDPEVRRRRFEAWCVEVGWREPDR